jgi:hypothetical protein
MKQHRLKARGTQSAYRRAFSSISIYKANRNPFLFVPLTYPIAFFVAFIPAVAAIVFASVIYKFEAFYFIVPGVWCYGVSVLCIHDVYRGKIRFRSGRIVSRVKSPIEFWFNIGIWVLFYLFAVAFPIGYSLQERSKNNSEQVAP